MHITFTLEHSIEIQNEIKQVSLILKIAFREPEKLER